jgi:hypothetical protein
MSDYVIRFKKSCRPYNAGETASFVASQARRLVLSGAAEYIDPPQGYEPDGTRKGNGKEPEGLRHSGGGWFELLEFKDEDGRPIRVKGKDAAVFAREELLAQLAEGGGAPDSAPEDENPDQDDGED